jgi:hypothetical protein
MRDAFYFHENDFSSHAFICQRRGENKKRLEMDMEEVMCFTQITVSLSPIVYLTFFFGILRVQAASN